jgi:hypothetical protein
VSAVQKFGRGRNRPAHKTPKHLGITAVCILMRCTNCGGERFQPSEYWTGSVRAPALECEHCRSLILDEEAAHTEEERDSVRLAVAARAVFHSDGSEEP